MVSIINGAEGMDIDLIKSSPLLPYCHALLRFDQEGQTSQEEYFPSNKGDQNFNEETKAYIKDVEAYVSKMDGHQSSRLRFIVACHGHSFRSRLLHADFDNVALVFPDNSHRNLQIKTHEGYQKCHALPFERIKASSLPGAGDSAMWMEFMMEVKRHPLWVLYKPSCLQTSVATLAL